jgi:hypothetical protein
VLGRLDGAAHYELVVELLASRLVDSLDERELIAALWWGPDLVFLRWQPPGPAKDRRCPGDNVRLADAIRASFEAGVRHALREHVAYRLDVVLGEARTS